MEKKKGTFLVIDGTDGSGKATQTAKLIERLRREGHAVETITFPRYDTPTGMKIKEYLAGTYGDPTKVDAKSASMLYADDRRAAAPEIQKWLTAGRVVVADRYVASNMGHQGGKISDPEKRVAFFRWNEYLEYGMNRLPRPDLNVILHLPAEIGQARARARGALDGHEQSLDHLKAAETAYLEIASTFSGFRVVECVENGRELNPDEIHDRVWQIIQPTLS